MKLKNRKIVGAAMLVGAVAVPAGVAAAAATSSRSSGPDQTYGVANPFADAAATVHVVANAAGGSTVTLHVDGVVATKNQTFGAHVHTAPCGSDPLASGGHYQHSTDPAVPLEQREVWLDVKVNGGGNGQSVAHRPWAVDQSTLRSVVIHAQPTASTGAAGARLACIDLDGGG